jgi:queuine tRNA-ribosyltransferase
MQKSDKEPENFTFELLAQDGNARAGVFYTPHGAIPTPIFAPVGTQGTVKSLTQRHLHELDAKLILANTYHLYLRPGDTLIAELGGLHAFMAWDGPILTDSGGFQVFSLADTRQVDGDGVTFKSHIDGSTHRFTPELSVKIQENLGSDIIMAFDECAEPYDRDYNMRAVERTHRWAERCLKAKTRKDQALFGIVQGGVFADLRAASATFIAGLDLPGNAIGGLSVGETKPEMHAMIEVVNAILPKEKPRYLMGVGTQQDLVECVGLGIDIFDCVLPTRLARHHAAMTDQGRMNLMNAQYSHDERPISDNCTCYTCRTHSRAYIRHLIQAREMLSGTLLSIHNIHTLLNLANQMREAIMNGNYASFAKEYLKNLSNRI